MSKNNQYTKDLAQRFHKETTPDLLAEDNVKLKREIFERAGVKKAPGWTILDIGCGGGTHVKFMASVFPKAKKLVGVDLSPEMIKIAKSEYNDKRIDYYLAAMEKMPFKAKTFDFVFSRNAIHYSQDLRKTFKEIYRVLKPGGLVYFQDSHPLFAFLMKKGKDYEKKEKVGFPIQGGTAKVYHPTFMLSEYMDAIIGVGFRILKYSEYFGRRSMVGKFRVPPMQAFHLTRD